MADFKGKVAVVGFGEVPTGKFPNRPCLASALESCRQAILDSGIDKNEIDTIIPTGTFFNRRYNTDMVFSRLVEELGLLGKAKTNMQVFAGGSSSSSMLKTASGLITAGLAKAVLCVQSDMTGSAPVQEMIDLFATFGIPEEWETPYGFFMGGCGSLFATRYMHETGSTHEQIASVVVSMRKWSALNPNAMLRRELTLEEVMSSKAVATNLTSREGNVLADGGAAFIVTTADRRKTCEIPPSTPGFRVEGVPLRNLPGPGPDEIGLPGGGPGGLRDGRSDGERRGYRRDLRRLPHLPPDHLGGTGNLRARRGRTLRPGGEHLAGRKDADDHERRDVGAGSHGGGGRCGRSGRSVTATDGEGRRAPGQGSEDRRGNLLGRNVHGLACGCPREGDSMTPTPESIPKAVADDDPVEHAFLGRMQEG